MRQLLRALVLLAGLLSPASALAQVPADAAWQTIESTHFRVTYERGLEHLARRAAASAERAHAGLRVLVADAPRGTIDIVVTDNVDFSNGYAMPFPSNRIVIFAKPPVDVLELQYTEDWIDMVVVHELAHIFHLDVAGPIGRVLRTVFGRVPFSWPFFPAVGTPRWTVEGLAVGIESTLTDAGRVHGSYHEMVVRTAVLQGRMDDIDRLNATTPVWPGPGRVYIYGSLFMDYLTRRYGPDATARIVRGTADAIIPPVLWFGDVGRRALGVTFRQAYADWQAELQAEYAALAADLRARGLTEGVPLTTHGGYALYPRFSRDGAMIAYAASDWRATPRVRAVDAATGGVAWSARTHDLAALGWLPDGGVVTSDMDFADRFRIHSDLHVRGGPAPGRITHNARIQHPDAARDGRRIVAVQNEAGTNRIVMVDRATGDVRPLTQFDEHVHWSLPRFAPDGGRIAAGRWRAGGEFDVVVLDTLGRVLVEVTREPGVSDAPAWSPDGRWLLFWSDRTGIPNLYAAEIGLMGGDAAGPGALPMPAPIQPRLRQVTNTLSGAFHPDVSPDSRWIVYAAYTDAGFRIERMPFDTAAWRDPMPAAAHGHGPVTDGAGHSRFRRAYPADDTAVPFAATVRAAVAAADTLAGEPRPYAALAHMRPYGWAPTVETGGMNDDFVGFWTWGADLVDRHRWQLAAGASLASGQTQGRADYTFAGLPTIPGIRVHPTLSVGVGREWELLDRDPDQGLFIEEREDFAQAVLGLARVRWRTRASASLSGERVRRSRHLRGFPPEARLRDPVDDLIGVRGVLGFSSFVMPPFAISRENGVILQLSARERHDRSPASWVDQAGNTRTSDGSYREFTSWNAGYLALPLPGFARHILAIRGSGLLRQGPGAGLSGAGGVSGVPFGVALPGIAGDVGGSNRLLPVRGFAENHRLGTRAWTASAEYRFPLLLMATSLRPLPAYADRLSGAVFADTGHAWCAPEDAARRSPGACTTDANAAPLIGAGAEITAMLSVYGAPVPLRVGAGVPLQGAQDHQPRWYILLSHGF